MQLKTLQIVWHGKEPVLSVDFQPNSHTLASGGQDGEVKHWEVVAEDDGSPGVRFLSSYPVNSKSVNCVRFSPAGDMLASAGDKGEVLIWRFAAFASGAAPTPAQQQQQPQQQQRGQPDLVEGGATGLGCSSSVAAAATGMWRQVGLLRGHCDDVLDLAWAPDGSALLSGGIENNCILWDVEGRKSLKWLQDHSHYIQGVAWDPLGRYVASQSADRTARVYAVKPPAAATEGGARRGGSVGAAAAVVTSAGLTREGFYAAATLSKGPLAGAAIGAAIAAGEGGAAMTAGGGLPPDESAAAAIPATGATAAKQPLFCDDSLPTFFRRLAWSPDGTFLAAPAGMYRAGISAPATSATHIFSRGEWSGPALSLPCLSKGALVVRFCPRLFRAPSPSTTLAQPLNAASSAAAAASQLPYRIIMAVASIDSVVLYDMQALEPLAVLGGIHFAAVTDLAWSDDGLYLVVASRDGYCTVCAFEEGELGEPVPLEELPSGVAAAVSRAAARRHQERTAVAAAAAKSIGVVTTAAAAASGDATEEQPADNTTTAAVTVQSTSAAVPRRIQPILISRSGAGSDIPHADAAAAAGATAPAAGTGVKRPAEAEPTATAAIGDRPRPKRIQPVPLSATALSATALGTVGTGAAARTSGVGSAIGATSTAPAALVPGPPASNLPAATAPPSPGRRRIVPMRVDGPSGVSQASAAAITAGNAQPAGGLSPLPSTSASAMNMAPSRTPVSVIICGGDGVIVPGLAAPGSGVKMPTPQVLVFGTPPSSAPRHLAAEPPQWASAAGPAASQQLAQAQPKPKRVTPVPVDRRNQLTPGSNAGAQPLQQLAMGLQPNPQGQLPCPDQERQQSQLESCLHAPETVATAVHDKTAVVSTSAIAAIGAAAAPIAGEGNGEMASTAAVGASSVGAGGGLGGARFSVAQLAAMRGAAAARKAAEGAM